MTVTLWAIFGMINGLLIHKLSSRGESKMIAAIVGGAGGISGGLFAYLIFGQSSLSLNVLSLIILILEGGVLLLLLSGRAFGTKFNA